MEAVPFTSGVLPLGALPGTRTGGHGLHQTSRTLCVSQSTLLKNWRLYSVIVRPGSTVNGGSATLHFPKSISTYRVAHVFYNAVRMQAKGTRCKVRISFF